MTIDPTLKSSAIKFFKIVSIIFVIFFMLFILARYVADEPLQNRISFYVDAGFQEPQKIEVVSDELLAVVSVSHPNDPSFWKILDTRKKVVFTGVLDLKSTPHPDFYTYSDIGFLTKPGNNGPALLANQPVQRSNVAQEANLFVDPLEPVYENEEYRVFGKMLYKVGEQYKIKESKRTKTQPSSSELTKQGFSAELDAILKKYPTLPKPQTKEQEIFLLETMRSIGETGGQTPQDNTKVEKYYLDLANSSNHGNNQAETLLVMGHKEITSNDFPRSSTVVYPSKTGTTKDILTIFSDPTCIYCRHLHHDIPKFQDEGYEVRYILFPRSQVRSDGTLAPSLTLVDYMQYSLCAKDRIGAIDKLYKEKGERKPEEFPLGECKKSEHDVMRNYSLGRYLVSAAGGTPLIMSKNGYISSINGAPQGYEDYESLLSALESLQGNNE